MKFAKVTSTEVAQRAGVSQSAVSRVYTPGASVSNRTAQKVRKAAVELGYRPNILARSLITGKSKIIGFIVAYLNNQFYPESLQKLSERLQAEGYHVLIFTVKNNAEIIHKTIQELLDYQVDGIIAASIALDTKLAQHCRALGVPVVFYNRSDEQRDVSYVTSDNIKGGKLVAQHFADISVKRPAYIAGWEGASTQREREQGFREGLSECGIELYAREKGDFNFEIAKEAARALFAQKITPDGIFVANDHMAFAVMDVLRFELGLSIPEDVVVAGYDDVEIANWPAYNLTSVRQPANRMVDLTVDAMLKSIEQANTPPIQQEIEGPLIVRKSTTKG